MNSSSLAIFWHFWAFFDVLGAILGATKIISHSKYLIFVCLIVLQVFHPCDGSHEGETPTIVKVSST